MIDITKALPEMLTGEKLMNALSVYPEYDESIHSESPAVRLIELSNIYNAYIANQMSIEIYTKLYLSIYHSLQKKQTKLAVRQQYENHRAIQKLNCTGIIGGSDSFTITGSSGIGKSRAIDRAISLICQNGVIETANPYSLITLCVMVQCPADCSLKSLLLEILLKTDELLNSDYYTNLPYRVTTDILIGIVSQVSLNHIGLLIIDEIQNVLHHRNGRVLIGALTQLINNSGISICMVGTPESCQFFEEEPYLARRSLGLQYSPMKYDESFIRACKTLFKMQYTAKPTDISESVLEWLYEHSGGIIANVVSLIHDSQEIAILNGKEMMNLETLELAYRERMALLHDYIRIAQVKHTVSKRKTGDRIPQMKHKNENEHLISDLVTTAKKEDKDVFELLKINFQVLEIEL